ALADYYISAYEVTQKQWRAVMGRNPSVYDCEDCPVTNVSYAEVVTFIEKLNALTGKHYRLPTEAEWEDAARGGINERLVKHRGTVGGVDALWVDNEHNHMPDKYKTGKKYSGKRLVQDVAWYAGNSKDHLHPVGFKKPNELGLYDMSGNAE